MKIILVGFMGVGKTTIGRALARRLEVDFVDMDKEIEIENNKDISRIFAQYGEKHFRRLESKMLKKLMDNNSIVISTGGGIVTTDENIGILKTNKKVIFLDASKKTIIEHLRNGVKDRPILNNSENIEDTINNLMNERHNKYIDVADNIIKTDNKSINEVILEILSIL